MFRVRTVWTAARPGFPYLTTMHFAEAAGTAAQAVSAVGNFWRIIDNEVATGVTWATEPDVEQVNEATGQVQGIFSTTPETDVGANGNSQLNLATQGLIRLRTGEFVGGREVRGRIFVPAPTEQANTNGQPDPAYLFTLQTAIDSLINEPAAALLVWSRPPNGHIALVANATPWTQWAVLRSRRD